MKCSNVSRILVALVLTGTAVLPAKHPRRKQRSASQIRSISVERGKKTFVALAASATARRQKRGKRTRSASFRVGFG